MYTKPGFILSRIKACFNSDDINSQEKFLSDYNKNREKQIEKDCYCGHTFSCDCSNPGISELKNGILNDHIKEDMFI